MTLDRDLFVEWWLVLCRRFNRDFDNDDPIDRRVASRYYRALDHLPDEAFERACDYVFQHNTYFPKPGELLRHGKEADDRIRHQGVRERMREIDAEEKAAIEAEARKLYPTFAEKRRIVGSVLEEPPEVDDE